MQTPKLIFITGVMAAGKSTVAQALAERLEPSMHLRGDLFRRMLVNGKEDMSVNPSPEALRQLQLRYQASAATAKLYLAAGFNVVYQDVAIGPVLPEVLSHYSGTGLHLVVLCPDAATVAQREAARGKTGYHSVTIAQLQEALAATAPMGLWLDTTHQSVAQSADSILKNLSIAAIGP